MKQRAAAYAKLRRAKEVGKGQMSPVFAFGYAVAGRSE